MSHQDDHIHFDDLPVVARYNVRADELAEEYMLEYQPELTNSPLLPACRCNFQLGPITHQGHFIREIRKAVSLPPLYAHLRKHHAWPPKTETEVDWTFFQEAADNYPATDNHLLKLVYDQLPTRKHKSRSAQWVHSTCKHCSELETFDHLMQCDHSLSAQFRTTLPNAVLHYCNTQNAPRKFTDLLLHAIRDFLHDRPPLQTTELPNFLHALIASQSRISWHLFMRGMFSTHWRKYLIDCIHRRPPGPASAMRMEPTGFLSGLAKTLWTQMGDFWKAHCAEIHKTKESGPSPEKELEFKNRIRYLYTKKHECLAAHRDTYFHHNLTDYLKHASYTQLRNYIDNYEPAIYASIKRAKKVDLTSSVLQPHTGFTRTRPNRPSIPRDPPTSHVANEVPEHPQHTRWRPIEQVATAFRSYFHPSTNPNPD